MSGINPVTDSFADLVAAGLADPHVVHPTESNEVFVNDYIGPWTPFDVQHTTGTFFHVRDSQGQGYWHNDHDHWHDVDCWSCCASFGFYDSHTKYVTITETPSPEITAPIPLPATAFALLAAIVTLALARRFK